MQVLTDAKVSTYLSWSRDADERSQLTLIMGANDATLAYEDSFRESTALSLSAEEAQALGTDLLKLVPTSNGVIPYQERAGASTNRVDQESGLVTRIIPNTDGEPYREGVRLEISRPDFTDVLYMDFDANTAHRLAIRLIGYIRQP
ncbi:hypothetical protein KW849_13425 [Pseudomonas sp. PDM26]|uniref:hypothetical protein n=1 Tax=Pseudomonas sp. PDM26 TaxID=2854766 RepID=UPI001C465A39|nr:hypothetical protein [Pseudomonas sp. PDM26]MBV7547290.1 hypothetical protein [Pseudomonas sp. PDM26]